MKRVNNLSINDFENLIFFVDVNKKMFENKKKISLNTCLSLQYPVKISFSALYSI